MDNPKLVKIILDPPLGPWIMNPLKGIDYLITPILIFDFFGLDDLEVPDRKVINDVQ